MTSRAATSDTVKLGLAELAAAVSVSGSAGFEQASRPSASVAITTIRICQRSASFQVIQDNRLSQAAPSSVGQRPLKKVWIGLLLDHTGQAGYKVRTTPPLNIDEISFYVIDDVKNGFSVRKFT